MVPSLVDELGETPEILEKLHPSKFICPSGGPVSPVSAGKVNQVVRVLILTGTTEGLFIGNLKPAREDWFWFCFHPYSGFEFKGLKQMFTSTGYIATSIGHCSKESSTLFRTKIRSTSKIFTCDIPPSQTCGPSREEVMILWFCRMGIRYRPWKRRSLSPLIPTSAAD